MAAVSFAAFTSDPAVASQTIVQLAAMALQQRCSEQRHLENAHQTRFHSSRTPQISMWDYIKRIGKYSGCSPECLIICLILLDRYVACAEVPITFRNVHRLTIACVLVTAKLRDDIYYSNAYYSSIGGVSNAEINLLELEFLTQIGWQTWVEPSEYEVYLQALWNRFGPSIAGTA
jgi:hypothetical protein